MIDSQGGIKEVVAARVKRGHVLSSKLLLPPRGEKAVWPYLGCRKVNGGEKKGRKENLSYQKVKMSLTI